MEDVIWIRKWWAYHRGITNNITLYYAFGRWLLLVHHSANIITSTTNVSGLFFGQGVVFWKPCLFIPQLRFLYPCALVTIRPVILHQTMVVWEHFTVWSYFEDKTTSANEVMYVSNLPENGWCLEKLPCFYIKWSLWSIKIPFIHTYKLLKKPSQMSNC